MRLWNSLFALAAALLITGSASAQLQLSQPGAAIVLPVITGNTGGGDTITSIIISNNEPTQFVYHVQVISGDPEDSWASNSFRCLVTPREVTHFLFLPEGAGSRVHFECSLPSGNPFDIESTNQKRDEALLAQTGVMFVAIENLAFQTQGDNALSGSATVVDFNAMYAFSVPGIPFQSGGATNTDRIYQFNGADYLEFPAVLSTTFHAPTILAGPTPGVDGGLIVFTLDGQIGAGPGQTPRVSVFGDAFNDDELPVDLQFNFDCFAIIGLAQISAGNLIDTNLGSTVGMLEMRPRSITQPNVAHDNNHGDGNGSRNSPFHGWIFQLIHAPGVISQQTVGAAAVSPIGGAAGTAGYARVFDQFDVHIPEGGDVPTLDAQ